MKTLKKCLPDVLAIVFFIAISYAYFIGPVTTNKILYQHDASAGVGAGKEASDYQKETGEVTRWTNSLFGGMPTYQTAPSYKSASGLDAIVKAYHLWLPENVWLLFVYLLGFYIMLRAFDFRQHLAALGSVIWAFSSYFLIIIAAGHLWKVYALAYLPPMIGGVLLAYRGKLLWGFLVTALFAAFEVNANHVQMTYYYLFIIFFMVLAFLIQAIREKKIAQWGKATAVCGVAALIGIAINASNLYHTWQYQKESMRGKSELVKKNTANQTDSGLERDYITQWSYGIDETWTLLIPNTKGGASVPLSQNATAMKKADYQVQEMLPGLYDGLPQYWGTPPMTSGPVYVGAFVLMLFILGLFIVKGPMKWALLAATILSILLSWGKNFMPLTDFFIDYFPMYSKFRTVASILVIAEFTIPFLAVLTLKKLLDEPDLLKRKMKFVYVSFVLTAGIAALFALIPTTFFDFMRDDELQMFSNIQGMTPDVLNLITTNISEMRQAMFTSDCWRTVVIILIGTAFLLAYRYGKLQGKYMVAGLLVLCLFDMWQVDKRYLNDGMLVPKSERDAPQEMTAVDEEILKDKTLDYRVMNLASNTFNENETSYYHKSIGGYHAAKLRRYQEMIERYIATEAQNLSKTAMSEGADMIEITDTANVLPVLNMLNTKYFIVSMQGEQMPVRNKSAFGNAWFVDKVNFVDDANQEIEQIGKIDLRHEAVADKQFKECLTPTLPKGKGVSAVGNDTIVSQNTVVLKNYAPNQLTYEVDAKTGGVVVFSEIYYPGWTATIDGQEAEVGRVNYILRALKVPAGKHQVVLSFFPKSIDYTETIAYIAFGLLILAILAIVVKEIRAKKKTE